MAWQYEPKFGVADLENDMCLIEARGGRDENRMFVRKISNDELVFGFRYDSVGYRVLTDAEKVQYPGYHATYHWLVTRTDLNGIELNSKQREIVERAMPLFSNQFNGFSVQIDGVNYKSLSDVKYVDSLSGY